MISVLRNSSFSENFGMLETLRIPMLFASFRERPEGNREIPGIAQSISGAKPKSSLQWCMYMISEFLEMPWGTTGNFGKSRDAENVVFQSHFGKFRNNSVSFGIIRLSFGCSGECLGRPTCDFGIPWMRTCVIRNIQGSFVTIPEIVGIRNVSSTPKFRESQWDFEMPETL